MLELASGTQQSWNLSRGQIVQPSVLWTSFFCLLSNPEKGHFISSLQGSPWTCRMSLFRWNVSSQIPGSDSTLSIMSENSYQYVLRRSGCFFSPILSWFGSNFLETYFKFPSMFGRRAELEYCCNIKIFVHTMKLVEENCIWNKTSWCEDSFWQQSQVDLCQVFFCGYFGQASLVAGRGHRRWLHSYLSLQGRGTHGSQGCVIILLSHGRFQK